VLIFCQKILQTTLGVGFVVCVHMLLKRLGSIFLPISFMYVHRTHSRNEDFTHSLQGFLFFLFCFCFASFFVPLVACMSDLVHCIKSDQC
jgi:hypothetical protein